ncbi:MAG: hypothetical protein RI897_163 [Verrucomicrobiota bacterium]
MVVVILAVGVGFLGGDAVEHGSEQGGICAAEDFHGAEDCASGGVISADDEADALHTAGDEEGFAYAEDGGGVEDHAVVAL